MPDQSMSFSRSCSSPINRKSLVMKEAMGLFSYATRKGKQLAIKVRHPRVAEQIANDFRLMNLLVEVIDRAIPALRCAALIASSRLSLRA